MFEMFQLPFMLQALIACVLMAIVLSYFGVHVVLRGIVFIDLALAQISSAGVALALLSHGDPRMYSLAFTLLGAFAFSMLQSQDKRIPQEAVIGITYAVASAMAILLLSKAPHADSDVTALLFGNILAISQAQIVEMGVVFALVALVHLLFRHKFLALSFQTSNAPQEQNVSPPSIRSVWNLVFYLTLALVISYAIRAAGVLLVFSYLIVPAVASLLLFRNIAWVFVTGAVLSILASYCGLYASYVYDLPTGAAIITGFGIIFALVVFLKGLNGFMTTRKSA